MPQVFAETRETMSGDPFRSRGINPDLRGIVHRDAERARADLSFLMGVSPASRAVEPTQMRPPRQPVPGAAPLSIYQAVTHGCIRVHPDEIARLFALVPTGAPGALIYSPVLFAQVGDDLYLEAHPDIYQRASSDTVASLRSNVLSVGLERRIDWLAVEAVLQRRAGVARVVSRGH